MNNIRIILAKWNEHLNEGSLYNNLTALGHQVFPFKITDKIVMGEEELCALDALILKTNAEAIFSFNYICGISDVCEQKNIYYISWIYDSPHLTLFNKNVFHTCNRIFHFDLGAVNEMKALGLENIRHLELACDIDSFQKTIRAHSGSLRTQTISYIASLYCDPLECPYTQIKYLPPYLLGYFEAAVSSALMTYGFDILDSLCNEYIIEEAKKYINIEISEDYFDTYKIRLKNILYNYSATVVRKRVVEAIAAENELWLYTYSDISNFKNTGNIHNMGTADYHRCMPLIFSSSTINLNITVRSIITGMSLRVLDVLGCGGFLLTNFQPEIAQNFENFKDLVMYNDEEELLELISYFSKNPEEAKQIATSGHLKCAELFNYKRQLERLFRAI